MANPRRTFYKIVDGERFEQSATNPSDVVRLQFDGWREVPPADSAETAPPAAGTDTGTDASVPAARTSDAPPAPSPAAPAAPSESPPARAAAKAAKAEPSSEG